ncbi:acetylxylan esterase [Vibrio astriarenae]|uniref:acetylxylan esterase n=1 Tax=Vibrio astriarenae TaxID=1481923 RepID=UPI0037361503
MEDMKTSFKHDFGFDPTYGYDLNQLMHVGKSEEPKDFGSFWQNKYRNAVSVKPHINIQDTGKTENNWRVFDCYYDSTNGIRIGGWLLMPHNQEINGAVIYAHGYGGIDYPDTSWNLNNTAILMPCVRGIGRSPEHDVSPDPYWHVLHHIQDKNQYIIAGCIQDLWCGINALVSLFPQIIHNIGFVGDSLGGGLGVFTSAFDPRVQLSHFHVPTFGNSALRLTMPCLGSTQALIDFDDRTVINQTLPYFDTSIAAKYLKTPTYWGLAKFDPFVAPPGQFSAYNACLSDKELYVLDAGHFEYPNETRQKNAMRKEVELFLQALGEKHAS